MYFKTRTGDQNNTPPPPKKKKKKKKEEAYDWEYWLITIIIQEI